MRFKQQKTARRAGFIEHSQAVLYAGCRPLDHQDHCIRGERYGIFRRRKTVGEQNLVTALALCLHKACFKFSTAVN